jgi:hypothetical protein
MPATLFAHELVAHVSGLPLLGLYRASAREKINRQKDERHDEQQVNQVAGETAKETY